MKALMIILNVETNGFSYDIKKKTYKKNIKYGSLSSTKPYAAKYSPFRNLKSIQNSSIFCIKMKIYYQEFVLLLLKSIFTSYYQNNRPRRRRSELEH